MMDWQDISTAPQTEWINIVIVARKGKKRSAMPAVFDGKNWRALSLVGMMPYDKPEIWMPLPEPPSTP